MLQYHPIKMTDTGLRVAESSPPPATPVSPGMLGGTVTSTMSTLRIQDLRKALSAFTPSKPESPAVSRELTFENEDSKSVDATKLFQLLLANSDDAMIETQI
eukprot:SAG31_NODE_21742_length_541_cov_120.018100_1_plen_101_part_10